MVHFPTFAEHRLGFRAQEGLKGGADNLWDLLFPWEHSLDSEVHLNDKGEIRADHDDPNGHLMPHNKYQAARYPGGVKHGRDEDGKGRPGITNSVASHLFTDNIVTAQPGFNAGMGRHIRAQQWSDWHRNWESKVHVPTPAPTPSPTPAPTPGRPSIHDRKQQHYASMHCFYHDKS